MLRPASRRAVMDKSRTSTTGLPKQQVRAGASGNRAGHALHTSRWAVTVQSKAATAAFIAKEMQAETVCWLECKLTVKAPLEW